LNDQVSIPNREREFSLLPNPDQLRGPPSRLISNWYQGHSPRELKKTHSPLYSAKVKNVWAYDSTPSIVFMARYLMKKNDHLTFLKRCMHS
jgi:hypothetical protein